MIDVLRTSFPLGNPKGFALFQFPCCRVRVGCGGNVRGFAGEFNVAGARFGFRGAVAVYLTKRNAHRLGRTVLLRKGCEKLVKCLAVLGLPLLRKNRDFHGVTFLFLIFETWGLSPPRFIQ